MAENKTVREQANELAKQALDKGQRPSALAIRDAIGTGSLGTIQDEIRKAKAEWHDGQRRQTHFPDLPAGLAQMASPFMEQLWAAACKCASGVFETERAAWQLEIESLHGDVDTAQQQQEILMDELSRVQSDLQHAEELTQEQGRSLELLRSELEHARAELVLEKAAAREQLQDLEQQHAEALQQASTEIRQHETRYALLNDDLIALRAEYESKVTALTNAHAVAIKGATEERDLARAKNAALQSELNTTRGLLQQLNERLEEVEAQRDTLAQQAIKAEQLRTALTAECDVMRQQVASLAAGKEEQAKLYAALLERLPAPPSSKE